MNSFAYEEDRVDELIQKSKTTRKELSSTLSKRDLASINESEIVLNKEYEELMATDTDKDWFKEVDGLIDN